MVKGSAQHSYNSVNSYYNYIFGKTIILIKFASTKININLKTLAMKTATTTNKAVLKDYVFEFLPLDPSQKIKLNSKSKIFVVINGIETSIPIDLLFLKPPTIDIDDVTGYSVLQMINNNKLKIDENTILDISFVDKVTNVSFYISKIRRPFGYDNDIEISVQKRFEYIEILLNNITGGNVPSDQLPAKPEPSSEELKALEDAKAKEKEVQELKEKEVHELKEKEKNKLGGKYWPVQQQELIDSGAKEYSFEDYRFFFKGETDDSETEIGFFKLVPGDFYSLDLYEEEITATLEVYSFIDTTDKELLVEFNKEQYSVVVKPS